MYDFIDKSRLFKQVDNSHLDEMIGRLWRRASIDANSSSSDTPPSTVDRSINYVLEDEPVPATVVAESNLSTTFNNGAVGEPCRNNFSPLSDTQLNDSSPLPAGVGTLCTIHMDMTYEDRVFFGVQNFYQLKKWLLDTQCNVDFSAAGNKVSIVGQVPNVQKMCEMFVANSTLSLQIEFCFFAEKCNDFMRNSFAQFHRKCELNHKVFVSYRRNKSNSIMFSFITFRNNGMGLIQAMLQLKNEVELCQMGEFVPSSLSSSLQIPANRRDLTGRANMYIEQVQKQTKTKIEVMRYDDCPQYPFESVNITGPSIFSVIQARFDVISRFTFELRFQVYIGEMRPLVEYMAKLSHDLKSIFISIEPSPVGPRVKILTITGHEKSISKLFVLREQLLQQVQKCNGFLLKNFLT